MIKLKLNNKIELILLISMLEAVYNELYVDSSFKMKTWTKDVILLIDVQLIWREITINKSKFKMTWLKNNIREWCI